MSDMSRPLPLHNAPDHELHDPLLVAQFVAGDVLDPADHARVDGWTATCAACAVLAADLRSVAGAVAWEPTPPRRRDYRLDAAQAASLRGNVVSRFMRRLALPQSTMLRPAAAGVLSIGLLMVVASTAWPGDDIAQLTSAPEAAPALDQDAAGAVAPDAGAFRLGASPAAGRDTAAEVDGLLGQSVDEAREAGPPAADEPPAPVERLRDADRPTDEQPSLRSEAANSSVVVEEDGANEAVELEVSDTLVEDQDAFSDDGARKAAADAFARQSGTVFDDDDLRDAELFAGPDASAPVLQGAEGSVGVAAPEGASDEPAGSAATPQPVTAGRAAGADDSAATVAAVSADSALDIQTVLLAVGSALAIAGGAVLVLVWLARRRADPLMR